MEEMEIIHCEDCTHCFKSRRSHTGYSCEVWGGGSKTLHAMFLLMGIVIRLNQRNTK